VAYAEAGSLTNLKSGAYDIPSAKSVKGRLVSQVAAEQGKITITYSGSASSKISGRTLVLEPEDQGASLKWKKGKTSTVDPKYLPATLD
jgi:sialic acid synthase SpsE